MVLKMKQEQLMEVESEHRSWWRELEDRSIGAEGGVVRGWELMEVESEDRIWWRWNRRIGADGGGIGADGGGIGAGGIRADEGGIGAGRGGIGRSEMMELESEDRS
ncbi:hypothetical protein B9Z55_002023 [Caenorhabditis nigoni]|uniref:Uncharacterized protein n=1 Tax=Caenorhabditis nigoni TaxID=1611254 RepID=A0A2G5VIF9_9PELO|nr:hypothetical protein B9Z55_002023 [Caenorhabditis nigoni]